MQKYMQDIMQRHERGLHLIELPTGIGKTYEAVQAMKDYVERRGADAPGKIIYLTTQNKNLPEKELKEALGEESYRRNVLRLRANMDEVIDKIEEINIPENMKTEKYQILRRDAAGYNELKKKNQLGRDYKKFMEEKIEKEENAFRDEIKSMLRRFPNRQTRIDEIRDEHSDYHWIGQLYQAVYTDDYPILLMTVSKFMRKNSILVDKSYEFLQSLIIEDAIIIIDEFDATKEIIQNEIIENSLQASDDSIELFRQISGAFRPDNFSIPMEEAMGADHGHRIMDEAARIMTQYHLEWSIKTVTPDNRQNYLFHDGSFHTVLGQEESYIRMTENDTNRRLEVFFENKETFYRNRKPDSDIVIYDMLREIDYFLSNFRQFVLAWAESYRQRVNSARDAGADAMSPDDAVSSLLDKLRLTKEQRQLLMGKYYRISRNERVSLLGDDSFYRKGMKYFSFEDSDSHHESTRLKLVRVYDTPEKIMAYLAARATVFGISATAELSTAVGNYDLKYLAERLGGGFHRTPDEFKAEKKAMLEKRWTPYADKKIQIHGEIIPEKQGLTTEDYLAEFMGETRAASEAARLIDNRTDHPYFRIRYCKILRAMYFFHQEDEIDSMLYLGMALPQKQHPELDEELLQTLFMEYSKPHHNDDGELRILRGDEYDTEKERLLKELADGKKFFVMSTYKTIGAGQNLQYAIPKARENDMVPLGTYTREDGRYLSKDFDALYLADITNATVNTYAENKRISEQELIKMLFQIEEVYENAEMNYSDKDGHLKLAFEAHRGGQFHAKRINKLYEMPSVKMQKTGMVLQAVGRMCRTLMKSPNVYLYAESRLLSELDADELRKHILTPEMEQMAAMCEELGSRPSAQEQKILNEAERISSKGWWKIRSLLSQGWDETQMDIWGQLRRMVLQHPTADGAEWEQNPYLRKYYITSGREQDSYLYSQYSDFMDVTIDFRNDREKFRQRAKHKGESDERVISTMSAEESGLPYILKYPGMKEEFQKEGYALEFKTNAYLMSPILFHNIYKGALGEVAGRFILHEHGIILHEIRDPGQFEYFDYRMSEGVYVDFKNWKYTYVQDKDEIRKKVLNKLEELGGRRVYVINIVSDAAYVPSMTTDERLVEIPRLLDENGHLIWHGGLDMIKREDYIGEDKSAQDNME